MSMPVSASHERPLVDVEVEVEAHLQQQAPLDHAGRDVGGADRAEQEGVEAPPLVEHAVGQDRAVAEVAGAAQVVVDGVQVDAGGAHDLEGLGDDLGADAVAADDSDLVAHCVSVLRLVSRPGPLPAQPAREMRNRPPKWTVVSGHRGADVRYRMMITGVHGRFIAGKCPPCPPPASTELRLVRPRAALLCRTYGTDPPPLAGGVRPARGRARRPDDARPGRDRPQDRDRPRAGRSFRERRLPRGQGRAGEDGGPHRAARLHARERRDRRGRGRRRRVARLGRRRSATRATTRSSATWSAPSRSATTTSTSSAPPRPSVRRSSARRPATPCRSRPPPAPSSRSRSSRSTDRRAWMRAGRRRVVP